MDGHARIRKKNSCSTFISEKHELGNLTHDSHPFGIWLQTNDLVSFDLYLGFPHCRFPVWPSVFFQSAWFIIMWRCGVAANPWPARPEGQGFRVNITHRRGFGFHEVHERSDAWLIIFFFSVFFGVSIPEGCLFDIFVVFSMRVAEWMHMFMRRNWVYRFRTRVRI